ncbi:MAG: lysophospholipid acyltransferase family protein [Gammaproteobacteria bacterium]
MRWLASLIFTLYFLLSTLIWSAVVACTPFMSFERRFALVRKWARSVMWMLQRLCGLGMKIEGAEHFSGAPVVILQKHSSAWETVAGTLYCPPHTWVLKRELMWIPVLNFALRAMNVIPINRKGRKTAINQVIGHGSERIRRNINVMIYPEGTRVARGQNGRFGRSGSKLAVSAGVPVVPVAHNAGDYWGRQSLLKKSGTVHVVIGEPIETTGLSAEEVNTRAARWLDETMTRISPAHAQTTSKI